ncbi:hypothetical protein BGX26_001788, partial [Mortierella sp. AD094]
TMDDSIYIVKDVPGKGKGMFATRDIKRGTCVISEKPLVCVGPSLPKTLPTVASMSKKNIKSFLALRNIYSQEEMTEVAGIIKTNALPLGENSENGGVYRVISRINHSCAPNVRHNWNPRTEKEYIRAMEDIPAGSEILTDYILPLLTREERQKMLLQDFRFTCQCRICDVASSKEYDDAVTRIKKCSGLILMYASSSPRKAMGYVREAMDILDKVGICGKTTFYYDGFQIFAIFGNYELAKEWANLYLESYRLDYGEEDEQFRLYVAYSQNPKSFPLFGRCGRIDLTGA